MATTVVERPPPSESADVSVAVGAAEVLLVLDMVVVVVVNVPFGAGKMVMVPHRTGPHGILVMPRNPDASPEYSI
jgi:hypothetical protein